MHAFFDSRYMYMAVDAWYKNMEGPSALLKVMADGIDAKVSPFPDKTFNPNIIPAEWRRGAAAQMRLLQRLTQSYNKPVFGISQVEVDGKKTNVFEDSVFETAFCKLLRFRKDTTKVLPRMLLIAPMSGHYATLLRDTVRDMLPYYDVYITDWRNARDVPISHGGFDMDGYIATLMRCFEFLAPDFHIVSICQSGVPAFAAVSLLEARKDLQGLLPSTLTVMGAPIDVRCSPTSVNDYANKYGEDWFESTALSIVPEGFPGERRLVYPGFMQLAAFLSMNPERHQKSMSDAVRHYSEGDFAGEEKISSFYAEYFSVMDLTAEFYLQTIRVVFQEVLLPQGKMISRGRLVDPKAIKSTAILAIEGERDDICGVGQTKAALDLAENLSSSKKSYLLLDGAGHYGLFNGHRFRDAVLPAIRKFTAQHSANVAKKKA